MAINTDKNTRINLTLPKHMKEEISMLANDEMRSQNSMILLLLKQALEQPQWIERIEQLSKHNEE